MNLKDIVEAALFASPRPLSVEDLGNLFEESERPSSEAIAAALQEISDDYKLRPVQVQRVASGYRFQVRSGFSPWLSRLFEERPVRYSRALLETLAIIAYRQPVTRGEIEDIRGVGVSSGIMRTLLEREWVSVVGHKEVPGRPSLYATTREFLDYFSLKSLNELPPFPVLSVSDEPPTANPSATESSVEDPNVRDRPTPSSPSHRP